MTKKKYIGCYLQIKKKLRTENWSVVIGRVENVKKKHMYSRKIFIRVCNIVSKAPLRT